MPISQVPVLNANSFQKVLYSGRTKPCVFFCEDSNSSEEMEYVVKLKAGMEHGVKGLAAELISSQLAIILGIPTPEFAIINIDSELAEICESNISERIAASSGPNFGSKIITGGYQTWPVGKSIPVSLKSLAGDIFAFDSLIQNPDRKTDKPNVLWKGDDLFVIDHEMGFSFIYDILPVPDPWRVTELRFMRNHLFYTCLKGKPVNLERFAGALESLSIEEIEEIIAMLPEEWRTDINEKIKEHLCAIRDNMTNFLNEVTEVLL